MASSGKVNAVRILVGVAERARLPDPRVQAEKAWWGAAGRRKGGPDAPAQAPADGSSRRSGTNHQIATRTYSAQATQGDTKASSTAAR